MDKTISFIIPTLGRESLQATLESIKDLPGDEVLVIRHDPLRHKGIYGNAERQEGTEKATGDYLAYMDDDDVYVPGAREIMAAAIAENTGENPILFKMQYPSGRVLWRKRWVKCGNVSTQMILVPNKKNMLSKWDIRHRWSDFTFINHWLWPARDIMWRHEIIAFIGHNDQKFEQDLTFSEFNKVRSSGATDLMETA